MSDREAIERRSEEAFSRSHWRDPRVDYRTLLRVLRERDAAGFERAVAEYEARVAERVADPAVDPISAWLDYGRRLAEIAGGGRNVRVDDAGRAEADTGETEPALLLHLPADESAPAIIVAEPREPSAAQRATVALLVHGRQNLGG